MQCEPLLMTMNISKMPFMTDVLSPGGSEGDILDNLKINPDTIAISGFSSGGYFSTQFHVAFSKKVKI